jgi:hypothetical protein
VPEEVGRRAANLLLQEILNVRSYHSFFSIDYRIALSLFAILLLR